MNQTFNPQHALDQARRAQEITNREQEAQERWARQQTQLGDLLAQGEAELTQHLRDLLDEVNSSSFAKAFDDTQAVDQHIPFVHLFLNERLAMNDEQNTAKLQSGEMNIAEQLVNAYIPASLLHKTIMNIKRSLSHKLAKNLSLDQIKAEFGNQAKNALLEANQRVNLTSTDIRTFEKVLGILEEQSNDKPQTDLTFMLTYNQSRGVHKQKQIWAAGQKVSQFIGDGKKHDAKLHSVIQGPTVIAQEIIKAAEQTRRCNVEKITPGVVIVKQGVAATMNKLAKSFKSEQFKESYTQAQSQGLADPMIKGMLKMAEKEIANIALPDPQGNWKGNLMPFAGGQFVKHSVADLLSQQNIQLNNPTIDELVEWCDDLTTQIQNNTQEYVQDFANQQSILSHLTRLEHENIYMVRKLAPAQYNGDIGKRAVINTIENINEQIEMVIRKGVHPCQYTQRTDASSKNVGSDIPQPTAAPKRSLLSAIGFGHIDNPQGQDQKPKP